MKKILFGLSVVLWLNSCQAPKAETIDADKFIETVTKDPSSIQIVDSRTPNEYDFLHIEGAINIDFNNPDWKKHLSKLDKNKPVYIYCLSGSRSSDMMKALQEEGYKEVYNLGGGLAKLNQEQVAKLFDVEKLQKKNSELGMNEEQLNAFIAEHKNVVVDFYADWCGPCKAMEPHLKELAEQNKDKFTLLKVNFDYSRELANKFQIRGIPHLLIYKDGKLIDQHSGFSPQILEQFKQKVLAPFK